MPKIHHAVIHTPGAGWQPAVPARDQPGLQDHVDHYAALFAAGRLKLGGPFFDARSGGIMVFEADVSESQARELASSDPAVKSGLLRFEVRPWAWVFHSERPG
jgi:uncharacterized protein YciI